MLSIFFPKWAKSLKNFLCVDRAEKTGVYLLKRGRKMKKAVVAGNSLTDVIKRIEQYPEKGMLAKITEVVPGVGGCVPNTAISLKTLAPWELDVSALSRIGKDENGEFILKTLSRHGVRTDKMRIDPVLPISFTDVMTLPNGERTFFCAAAATGLPLVMHGGSGVSDEGFRKAIEAGIRKINYYSYMSKAGYDAAAAAIASQKYKYLHDVEHAAMQAMKEDVKRAISVFSGI